MKRFTCGHTAGANADTSVPCASCALRLTRRTISHTISATELAQTAQAPVDLVMEWTGSIFNKLLAAGFHEGELTITIETKEG